MMDLMSREYYEAVRDCTPEDCGECALLPATNRACHMVDVDPRDEARMILALMDERDSLAARVAELEAERDRLNLLLAGILRNRFEILAPHHAGAIKEWLGYPTDEQLDAMIISGKTPMGSARAALEPR